MQREVQLAASAQRAHRSSFVTTQDESPSSSQPRPPPSDRTMPVCFDLRPCGSQSSLPKPLRSECFGALSVLLHDAGAWQSPPPVLPTHRCSLVRTHGCLQSRSSLARQTSLRAFANSGSEHSSTRRLSTSAQCAQLCPSLHGHAMPQRIPSLCRAVRRGVPPPMRSARPRREDRLSGSERLCERAKVSAMSCRATLEGLN